MNLAVVNARAFPSLVAAYAVEPGFCQDRFRAYGRGCRSRLVRSRRCADTWCSPGFSGRAKFALDHAVAFVLHACSALCPVEFSTGSQSEEAIPCATCLHFCLPACCSSPVSGGTGGGTGFKALRHPQDITQSTSISTGTRSARICTRAKRNCKK